MKKVQQKRGASKKVARDRRILAKARREDGQKWPTRPFFVSAPSGDMCIFPYEDVKRLDKLLAEIREEFRKAMGGAS